jgi:DnaJ-class molecular chaperone
MIIEGVIIHDKCEGLGIIEKDGKGEICEECKGTGMVYADIEI